VTGLYSRPLVWPPAATSTSTTSPGWTTVDPVGVPVRTTSPGSSVISREMSATMSANPNSRSSPLTASCASSPLTQVRSRTPSGSTIRASISSGPSGVKPSIPLDRTLEPRSAYRRSYTPKSLAAVTHPTWSHAPAGLTRVARVPMTSATSPSKVSSSHPGGRATGSLVFASVFGGLRKYDGHGGSVPRSIARLR
jgi:hypothetical protein